MVTGSAQDIPVRTTSSKAKRNIRSALLFKKVFIVTIILLAQILFFSSDFFRLRDIRVYGNNRVKTDEIIQTANFPMEHNVVTLPLLTFRDKLAQIHWIKDVRLKWNLPGRVDIYVEERTPVILARKMNTPADQWYAADEYGMVLFLSAPEEQGKYPKMVIEDEIKIGKTIPSKKIQAVRDLEPWMPEDLRQILMFCYVDELNEIIIFCQKNNRLFKVKMGKAEDMERKIKFYTTIMELAEQNATEVEYIDLRPKEPVLKPVDVPFVKTEDNAANNNDEETKGDNQE